MNRNIHSLFFLGMLLALILGTSSAAMAVSCTIHGNVQVLPLDGYYCDTAPTGGSQSCSGWTETNLDTATKPLQYIKLSIREHTAGTFLLDTFTDSAGAYSATVTLSGASCVNQQLRLTVVFARVHESDAGASTPRYRFHITPMNSTSNWGAQYTKTLLSSNQAFDMTFPRDSGSYSRLAHVYFTANSAISQIITRSSNLSTQFADTSLASGGAYCIWYESGFGAGAGSNQFYWATILPYDYYNRGGTIRHEIGHITHFAMHYRNIEEPGCFSYDYNSGNAHTLGGLEWGSAATYEGIATFLGVRSITSNNLGAWWCVCNDDANQDTCSETAIGTMDSDRLVGCGGGAGESFLGIGDTFASSRSHCIQSEGWRNESQVARFLWDMIDNNDEGGDDDTNLSMSGLAQTVFETMTCWAGSGYDTDASCNEPHRADLADCSPQDPEDPAVTPMGGTRDSYNMWDLSDLITGDQFDERDLNCGEDARD